MDRSSPANGSSTGSGSGAIQLMRSSVPAGIPRFHADPAAGATGIQVTNSSELFATMRCGRRSMAIRVIASSTTGESLLPRRRC